VCSEERPVLVQAVYDTYDMEPISADVGGSPNCRFIFIGRYLFISSRDSNVTLVVTSNITEGFLGKSTLVQILSSLLVLPYYLLNLHTKGGNVILT
jgi:hypothetical protein